MVQQLSPLGLIAATRMDVTPSLEAVLAGGDWPLVLAANPRRLAQELAVHDPECLLFWLDDRRELAATARLVEWSRQRGARPYRVTAAYRLEADVEAALRAAGTHSFLAITERPAAAIADALRPILATAGRPPATPAATATATTPHTRGARSGPIKVPALPPALLRPP